MEIREQTAKETLYHQDENEIEVGGTDPFAEEQEQKIQAQSMD